MRYRKGLRFLSLLCLCATAVGTGTYFVSKWTIFRPLIEPDDDGRTIVTKYVKALGGDDQKLILKTGYIKYTARVGFAPINDSESIVEDTFDFPRHFKRVVQVKSSSQNFKMIFVTSDGKGWKKVADRNPEPLEAFNAGEKEHDLATLWNLALALEENVQLTRLGEERVGKHATVIVHVSGENGYESYLYFDKRNALLIKSKRLVPAQAVANFWATAPGPVSKSNQFVPREGPGKLMAMEVFLGDYQKVQGRMVPMEIKCYQDGEQILDVTLKEVKFLERIDSVEFAGP